MKTAEHEKKLVALFGSEVLALDYPPSDTQPDLFSLAAQEQTTNTPKRKREGMPDVMRMSESSEWYTPSEYLEAVRALMGSIDLDPASNPQANETVRASVYYTKETNGFTREWTFNGQPARVFLNPPYGFDGPKCNQARWSAKLIEQYQKGNVKEAVLLVNAVTDRKWFAPLWDYPVCFTNHRIKFYGPVERKTATPMGSALVYFGPVQKYAQFYYLFKRFGRVVIALPAHDEQDSLWVA